MNRRINAIALVCLLVAGCRTDNMLWTRRDSWHTGFPSQPPWCDDEQHEIHEQRLVPVPDVRLKEAAGLLADASIVEIDLATAQGLTGIPNLNPDELLRAAMAEAMARADKREMEAQNPFFATHAELFREEVREQRAAASQAEALLGKLKPYLVRAVVLWEGKANQEVALEPGVREVLATYTIRDEEDDSLYQSDTQAISYFFEGGKRYRLYVLEHFDWCEICIGRF